MSLTDLRCPSCSAPFPAAAAGRVTCSYCHVTSVLDAEGARALAEGGEAEEAPVPFWWRLFLLLRGLIWLGLGFALVAIPFAFLRGEAGELVILYALGTGLGSLVAVAEGQKLLATLACGFCGVTLFSKPWVRPLILSGEPLSATSETSCYFSVPGAALLLLAILIGLSLVRRDLEPGWPRRSSLLLLGVGALAAGYLFAQPTRAEVAAEHLAEWEALRRDFRAALLAAPAPLEDYSELSFEDDDPRGTNSVQFLSWDHLDDPNAPRGHFYPGGEDLRYAWQAAGVGGVRVSDAHRRSRADERFQRELARARRARFLVVYRVLDGLIEVFLYDLRQRTLRVRRQVPCSEPNGILEGPAAVLGALGALPGAQVTP